MAPWKPLAVVAAFITYGSLYPFDFGSAGDSGAALRMFLRDWRLWTSRGDVLGNVGLFVPFGAAGVYWVDSRREQRRAAVLTLLGGISLAFALQLIQVWVRSRSAVLADVVWNTVGVLAGIAGGVALSRSTFAREARTEPDRLAATVLIGLWVLAELAPFVPSLDFQGVKRALRPLLLAPVFVPVTAVYAAAQVVVLGRLFEAVAGRAHGLRLTAGVLTVAAIGKVLVLEQSLDWSTVAGFTAGFSGWALLARSRGAVPVRVALGLMLGAYTLQAFAPFQLRDSSVFAWVPFGSVLDGSMLSNLRAMAATAFSLGGCVWLMRNLGWRVRTAAVGLAAWVLMLEILQIWIVGRTASSTEPATALLVGVFLGWNRTAPLRRGAIG